VLSVPVDRHRALGRVGERLAVSHLEARGFSTLARNYRTQRGEIDLIAFDGRTLIFVQVKTRQVGGSGTGTEASGLGRGISPLEYLSSTQIARYRWVAEAWIHDKRYEVPEVEVQSMRFDAIGVLVDAHGRLVALEHVEGDE
jgi:putative endonuclease